MGIVYIITNNINGKKYIGVDTKNKKNYFGSGVVIKLALKKYGKENFIKEILETNDDNSYLFEKEKYWITYYNATESLDFYNISDGGKGGNMLNNEESIKKHRIGSAKGTLKTTNFRKGKTYKEIYGETAEIEKEKRRIAGLNKKYSKERIEKISNALKGRIPWNKGLTKDDLRVKKNTENQNRKPFIKQYILNIENNKIIFNGRKKLENYIKIYNINKTKNNKININKLIHNNINNITIKIKTNKK